MQQAPDSERGRAAGEWKTLGRPQHGERVLAFYRNDHGQGVDIGVFSQENNGELVMKGQAWSFGKLTNQGGKANAVDVRMPWRFYSKWAPVYAPPQETL